MGLLDDAIREHLELKRRRGADPGEIAHEEHVALSPVFPPEEADAAASTHDDELHEDAAAPPHEPDASADATPVGAPHAAGDAFHAGEETAEIDMQAVLDGEDVDAVAAASSGGTHEPVAARVRGAQPPGVLDDDALEWEMPGTEAGEEVVPEIPGQERMSFE